MRILCMAVMLIWAVALSAANVKLKEWHFDTTASVKKTILSVRSGGKAVCEFDQTEKALKIEIVKHTNHPAHISWFCNGRYSLRAGDEYIIRCRVKSSTKVKFQLLAMQNHPQWKLLGEKANVQCELDGGKYQWIECSFRAAFDEKQNVRIPSLFLGKLPDGAKLWIAEISFSGPDPEKIPVVLGKAPKIPNFSNLHDWSFKNSWKENDGERTLVSLNAYWEFFPGSAKPGAETIWKYFRVPGKWRGGVVSNYMRTSDGAAVEKFFGKVLDEYHSAWYRRTIEVPGDWKKRDNFLEFRRISKGGELFLNGKKIKLATGYNRIPVSSLLKYGMTNTILIRIDAPGDRTANKGGILGYVFLGSRPEKNLGDPIITTSLSNKCLTVDLHNFTQSLSGSIEAVIRDASNKNIVFKKKIPCAPQFKLDYVPPKLWSPSSPSLYYLDLTLIDKAGRKIDRCSRRFGFREFRIANGKYYLNNQPILLKSDTVPIGRNWSVDWHSGREFISREMKMLKKMNLNTVYCNPDEPSDVFEVADEEGVLILLWRILPYNEQKNSSDAQIFAKIDKQIALMKSKPSLSNHPSQIGILIDVWFNLHFGTLNPAYVGLSDKSRQHLAFASNGKVVKRATVRFLTNEQMRRKKRLDAIGERFRKAFPYLEIFTGGSGEVAHTYGTHIYHTWGAPLAEMRAFFSRWGMQPDLPIFIGETNLPYPGSFYEINKFHGGRGSNPLFMENIARSEGNLGYRFPGVYARRPNHDHGLGSLQSNSYDFNGTKRYNFYADLYLAVLNRYMINTIPAWRYSGVSGIGMFSYVLAQHFALAGQNDSAWKPSYSRDMSAPLFVPENKLGGPGPGALDAYGPDSDLRPNTATVPFQEIMNNLSCSFFGPGHDPFEQDHAYFSGEVLKKKLVVLNDTAKRRKMKLTLSLISDQNTETRCVEQQVSVKAFEHKALPVDLKLPEVSNPSTWKLRACFSELGSGQSCLDTSINLQIFPPAVFRKTNSKLTVCDPEGKLIASLKRLNCSFEEIPNLENPPSQGILIIGRKALSLLTTIPDFTALADSGLNILILEQKISASKELMKTRTRAAFINAQGHPVFNNLRNADFRNWRGSHSLIPAYQTNQRGQRWADWGNRNMLASLTFRRPAHGNFRSLLVSGFDLFQTPLLEYTGRNGSWIGSQLELTERIVSDPTARQVLVNLIDYLDNRGKFSGNTLFFGGDKGEVFLKKMGIEFHRVDSLDRTTLDPASNLIIVAPDFKALEKFRFEISAFVYHGGRIYYFQKGKDFSSSWLPFTLTLEKRLCARLYIVRILRMDFGAAAGMTMIFTGMTNLR